MSLLKTKSAGNVCITECAVERIAQAHFAKMASPGLSNEIHMYVALECEACFRAWSVYVLQS
jgi:hypothetical protein